MEILECIRKILKGILNIIFMLVESNFIEIIARSTIVFLLVFNFSCILSEIGVEIPKIITWSFYVLVIWALKPAFKMLKNSLRRLSDE